MKTIHQVLFASVLISTGSAQPSPPPVVVEKTVTETVSPGKTVVEETVVEKQAPPVSVVFDPSRQLSIIPRVIPGETVVPIPGQTTETTETTTTRVGSRVYNVERSVVVVEGRELPYITIPVLFVKETAELLDSESRVALDKTAAAIVGVIQSEPTAMFEIEGHTSTDGTDEMNATLSAARARRVYEELTVRYKIPPAALRAQGYGESYPAFPNGSESEMMLDRRVLVVRTR